MLQIFAYEVNEIYAVRGRQTSTVKTVHGHAKVFIGHLRECLMMCTLKYSVLPQRVVSLSSGSRIKSLIDRDAYFYGAYFLKLDDLDPR